MQQIQKARKPRDKDQRGWRTAIASEADFQRWLLVALRRERKRMQGCLNRGIAAPQARGAKGLRRQIGV
ncbi:MAG: hypothetical protein ACRD4X_11450 [Candidatus Acidiferrales bacterium]